MQIHHDPEHFDVMNPVVSMGIFDGVHLGHHEVISGLKKKATEIGGESVIITFWPHPRQILNPTETNLKFLSSMKEKTLLLEQAGIDHLVILPFTRAVSKQDACTFIEETLVKRFGTKHLIVGYNHSFGKDRVGDYDTIKECAGRFGFEITKLEARMLGEEKVSSTIIREALWSGKIEKANRLLGYNYFVAGKIIRGRTIGRKIGFPTANISPGENYKLVPSDGVYAVILETGGMDYKGMLNIGVRPTVDNEAKIKTIEVNIFDFNQDIYGQELKLVFIKRIRNETKFDSIESLVDQLQHDRIRAGEILSTYGAAKK